MNADMKEGKWKQIKGRQLSGLTVGIIGCGPIGRDVIHLIQPYQCKLLLFDQINLEELCTNYKNVRQTTLENLLTQSDVITLHLPLNEQTKNIINSDMVKLIKKNAPHIKWILSFADGTQCGDGTIYRASGFILTNIKKNNTIWKSPEGKVKTDISLRLNLKSNVKKDDLLENYKGGSSMKMFKDAGWKPIEGYQLRYVYFIDKNKIKDLTVEPIPFYKIKEMGASMYKGKRIASLV